MWCPMLQAPRKVVDIATRSLHLPPCSEHTCQLPGCNITLTAGSVMTVKGRYHGAGGKWNGPTPKWARLQYRMLYTRVSHAAFRTSAGKTNWASLSCGRWHPSNYQRSHFFSVIRFFFFFASSTRKVQNRRDDKSGCSSCRYRKFKRPSLMDANASFRTVCKLQSPILLSVPHQLWLTRTDCPVAWGVLRGFFPFPKNQWGWQS